MKSGLSLIEVLVVLAIIGILSAVVFGNFGTYRANQALQNSGEGVLSFLNSARSRTLFSEDSSQYGVHLEQSKTVLFKGVTYSAGANDNREFILDPSIEIVSVNLAGGGDNIVFERLSGATDQDGTFVLRVKTDFSKQKTFTIEKTGIVSVN
ncbi:hypothetical protein A3I25_02695 [Candidatus Nomurabacteria bacterium RIFCSPLOWO2_02_FULL_42_17]|uniref:General secretion pathway GspH domain-containing protein n=1 Tax=Candidatus Nomurabacteria bacterium RIFCSPLOWO2_02_FULL_42_17 TaxID=1801789 RepID=A0A1F6XPJ4_9BACT|nr:MAG: hypothetical protein UV08_C0009G0005 [Parcubacteria group bacterium GW2011_GWA2_42_18]OGI96079.1 MAG: hypothetical protein A3I25_02695 [Candidatus Nomurabacteria bacterium RIFCSPLOWO2_02_FULL_42_17]